MHDFSKFVHWGLFVPTHLLLSRFICSPVALTGVLHMKSNRKKSLIHNSDIPYGNRTMFIGYFTFSLVKVCSSDCGLYSISYDAFSEMFRFSKTESVSLQNPDFRYRHYFCIYVSHDTASYPLCAENPSICFFHPECQNRFPVKSSQKALPLNKDAPCLYP